MLPLARRLVGPGTLRCSKRLALTSRLCRDDCCGGRMLTTVNASDGPPRRSTTAIGTLYECAVVHTLVQYGMRTQRVGQAGDRGIDFRGQWELPNATIPVPLVGQCKYRRASARSTSISSSTSGDHTPLTAAQDRLIHLNPTASSPTNLRDLEGTLSHQAVGAIGLLVANQRFGLGTIRQLMGSQLPLMLVTLALLPSDGPLAASARLRCLGIQWNHAVERQLPGLMAVPQYSASLLNSAEAAAALPPEMVLLFNGEPLQGQ